jgi:hypothetical protein
MVAAGMLAALEADVDQKRHELEAASVLANDLAEKIWRLWEAKEYENALALTATLRERYAELTVATESWILSMRRIKAALGIGSSSPSDGENGAW